MSGLFLAERAGFEPAFPYGKHALQACALGQTTRPLRIYTGGFLPAGEADYTITLLPYSAGGIRVVLRINEHGILHDSLITGSFQDWD